MKKLIMSCFIIAAIVLVVLLVVNARHYGLADRRDIASALRESAIAGRVCGMSENPDLCMAKLYVEIDRFEKGKVKP
jgi:hypothetical protein